jgi:stearoyl-CoA desaturase (delta-9 desaturase)
MTALSFLIDKYNKSYPFGRKMFRFHVLTHLALLYFIAVGTSFQWFMFLIAYFLYACVGFSIGFHRMLAHRAFKEQAWFRPIAILFGTLSGIGSALSFVSTHRDHHRYSDRPGDAYSMYNLPGWYAQWFPMFEKVSLKRSFDLFKDPTCRFTQKHYFKVHMAWAALLFLIDPMAVIYFYLAPVAVFWSAANSLNTLSHWPNTNWLFYRNFDTKDKSVCCIPIGIYTFGEGWHNNHHHNGRAKNFKVKWWEFDISYHVIKLVEKK